MIARVLGVHGVRGELRIEPLAPESCFRRGLGVSVSGVERRIERFRGGGKTTLLKLEGIDDRETAAVLRGEYVEAAESSLEPLPEGDYYRFQLVGLNVRTTNDRDLGQLTDVMATGGTDVYVIRGPLGEILIPATEDIITDIDLKSRIMTIEPIPGLLPD